jgi:hypothetical protein
MLYGTVTCLMALDSLTNYNAFIENSYWTKTVKTQLMLSYFFLNFNDNNSELLRIHIDLNNIMCSGIPMKILWI